MAPRRVRKVVRKVIVQKKREQHCAIGEPLSSANKSSRTREKRGRTSTRGGETKRAATACQLSNPKFEMCVVSAHHRTQMPLCKVTNKTPRNIPAVRPSNETV